MREGLGVEKLSPMKLYLRATAMLMVLGLLAGIAVSCGETADELPSIRALIAEPLRPEPGLRVIELPGGLERLMLEDVYDLAGISWSPTGEHFFTAAKASDDSGAPMHFLLVSYPAGDRVELEFAETEFASSPSWSPDGTRVVFVSDHRFYLFTTSGELIAEYSEESLGVDLRQLGGSVSFVWSEDSRLVLARGSSPTQLIDRNGQIVGEVIGEEPDSEPIDEFFTWWPGESSVLFRTRNSPNGASYSRLEIEDDGDVRETELGDSPEILQILFAPPGSRPILAALEENVPAGEYAQVSDRPVDRRAWIASLQLEDEPRTWLNAIQLSGLFYSFKSRITLDHPGFTGHLLILDPPVDIPVVPPSDTSNCPVHGISCQRAANQLDLLLANDVEALMEVAHPSRFHCKGSTLSGARDVCEGSTAGVSRYGFTLDAGDGEEHWVLEPEFQDFLESIAERMDNAEHGLSDQFGSGSPSIVSLTTGPPLPGNAGLGPPYVNISWIEGSDETPLRVVLGLDVRGGGAVVRGESTGHDLALVGGQDEALPDATASLWSAPE